MQQEGISPVERVAPSHLLTSKLDWTLICFVLVDPEGHHAFCSRHDFGPWPLLQGVHELSPAVVQVCEH